MVCDDDGGIERDGFFGYGFCEIDGEEDSVCLTASGDEGCFEEETGIVPGVVCKGLRVAVGL